jgi:hypothetical protein
VLPWTATVDPWSYRGVAELIWQFELAEDDAVPFGAWYAAGGAGIWLHFTADCSEAYRATTLAAIREWERTTGRQVWLADATVSVAVAPAAAVIANR